MQSKILGRTGLEVPIVSFGTAFLARTMGADGRFRRALMKMWV